MVRVDNASIPRGKKINITVVSQNEPTVIVEALNPKDGTIATLSTTILNRGDFWDVSVTAQESDGFMLIRAGGKRIVKKVGYPLSYFVIGIDSNADSIHVYEMGSDGHLIRSSTAFSVSDGFYSLRIGSNTGIVRVGGKYYDVRKNDSNLGLSVDIEPVSLQDISIFGVTIVALALPDVTLPNISLEDISMNNISLQDISIKEV